jgi:hypothetical protein
MDVPKYSNIKYLAPLKGSTGTELYQNNMHNKWVVKKALKAGGFDQIISESAADDIYELLLVPVPKHKLDYENKALILQHIDGKLLQDTNKEEFEKAKKELQQGFVVDALLANCDVIGLNKDNIIIPSNNSPAVRIDNGGSLAFKATGGKKQFGTSVIELDTMRNKKINPSAYSIFGDLTDTDIDKQIKSLIIPNNMLILSLTPDNVKPIIKKRLDYLIERTVWTNASAFKNTVKESAEPEYIPQVQKAIIKYFKQGWLANFKPESNGSENESNAKLLNFINNVLKDHQAVISGGFILKAIGAFVDEKSVDMDVYVPTDKADKFREIMTKLFNSEDVIKHVISEAPGSFFKKNGILSVTKYSKTKPIYAEMDIVEVNSDRTPIDVVKNFDLTFCENWYDGENVYMTYPEHVKTKHGFLENHYLNILFSGNPVLINRMKKYIQRGFKISIHNPSTKKVENITEDIIKGTIFTQQTVETPIRYGSYGIPDTNKKSKIPYISDTYNESLLKDIKDSIEKRSKNAEELNNFDILSIRYYTGVGSTPINRFLHTNLHYFNKSANIIKLLMKKFPINSSDSLMYDNKLMYYYFINLYNAIQKGGVITENTFFKVYRGTKTWYLENNENYFYYMNSFVSTTLNLDTAISFGKVFEGKYNKIGKHYVYVLYLHPLCVYNNITDISRFKREKEVLLTPYHRYLYVDEEVKENIHYKKYMLFPTDLDIPQSFESFMPWKNNISRIAVTYKKDKLGNDLGTLAMNLELPKNYVKKTTYGVGGRITNIIDQTEPFYNMNTTFPAKKLNTLKRINIKPIKMSNINSTMKNKVNNTHIQKVLGVAPKNTNQDLNIERFTDPIPSFPGKAPTEKELQTIKNMIEYIKKDTIK